MRAETDPEGRLVVTNREYFVLGVVVALAIGAGLVWRGDEPVGYTLGWSLGLLAAAALVLGGVEQSTFVFDPARRELAWRRTTPYRDRRGTVAFADVTMLSLERGSSRSGGRSNTVRLVLHTTTGVVPFTNAFTAGRTAPRRVADEVIATLRAAEPRREIPLVE